VTKVTEIFGAILERFALACGTIKYLPHWWKSPAGPVHFDRQTGATNTSIRLPDFRPQVNAFFVAVPQIERNWAAHRPATPTRPEWRRRDSFGALSFVTRNDPR
jgi:hypothetical protein